MKVHFISIGGSAMHNLAIALKLKGINVTGSDDEIFEPSKSRLEKHNLLPKSIGWNTENITPDLDAIILGMHAREDNPELIKAKNLGLKIYSYPEYIYEQSKDKTRVVIGGSHGKTTITAMLLHVLHKNNIDIDYLVGAQLSGFDTMVRITNEAKIMIIEGDEYLASPIDRRPKFHLYKPDLAVLSGIAWDHINVFPTFENYVQQFEIFLETISNNGFLAYCGLDNTLVNLVNKRSDLNIKTMRYGIPAYEIIDGKTFIISSEGKTELNVFGEHNLQNINAAYLICKQLGLTEKQFFSSISSFKGASKRLELIAKTDNTAVYKDFAHSPSKLKATTSAMKKQFDNRKLIAVMELHTFSSLTKAFLKEYDGAMVDADEALIYFNLQTIEHKKLEKISADDVLKAFNSDNIKVFTNSNELIDYLLLKNWNNKNLLLMTSGNFDGVDLSLLGNKICKEDCL